MLSRKLGHFLKRLKPALIKNHRNYQPATAKLATEPRLSDLNTFKVGDILHGFQVKDIQDINEFKVTAIYLVHQQTKAEYLHLYRNDNNNVFSVNFRTTPLNSTGLPHILEHTVLCGSKLYPVRDPFFKMLNRSLATFMNAMTGSDFTMYPFSTQNWSDYKNLQKIYLDAVFRPNLKELDFMQEGWRLENVDLKDIKSDLIIKGVVYNEMKGVFSENDNILANKIQNLILPDDTYGVISGGDPMEIPNLTWEDLKAFHKLHYHPSNCRIYSYGNFPLLPSLQYVNDEYLINYDYQPPSHIVPKQKRWNDFKREHCEYRFEIMKESFDKQNVISISLLLSDINDVYETFLMQFITQLLIKGPNSPFYKSMIEPNISSGFTSTTGFDNQVKDTIFTIGLQGIKRDDFDNILTIFDKTIDDIIKSGFDQQHIESILHLYELIIKHETSNFGLNLLFSLTPIWNHNGNVINVLKINSLIEKLKNEMSRNQRYLQNTVKQYFKDNRHRLILTMSPDESYEKKQEVLEKNLLKNKIKSLNESKRKEIFTKCLTLQETQNIQENTDILPTLQMDDISNSVERVPIEKLKLNSIPIQINKIISNGIVYFKGLLSTVDLTPEQQMLLPLFCNIITKLGTNKLDYRLFDSLANRKTSGLNLSPYIGESLFELHSYEPGILISSYCLEKNLDSMWDLWSQIFNITQLNDVDRFKMLVQLYMSDLTNGIVDSGHIYAMQAASGLISGSAYQKELLLGLQHISYMKGLILTSNYRAMLDEIVNIAQTIFNKNNMRVAFNITQDKQQDILKSFENFAKEIPNTKQISNKNLYITGKVWVPPDSINCQHHVINIPVNYCSKAVLTAPYNNSDYSKLKVLARLLSAKYLHPELREKQGAYGGGAKLTQSGVFTFYSYRDPRNLETLDIFDESHKWLINSLDNIKEQELLEAKLGVFQQVDAPISPCNKGCDEFLYRLTPDMLQKHRSEIMSVNKNDLKLVADKYLGDNDAAALNGKVVLGPKNDKFNTSNRPHELWTVMDNIGK